MLRACFILLSLLVSVPTLAKCTWETISQYEWKAVCPSGSNPAPTMVTEGFPLSNLVTYVVTVEARRAGASLVSIPEGSIMTYIWDTQAGAWSECKRCFFYSVPSLSSKRQTIPAIPPPVGIETRIALIPVAVQVTAGGVTLFITGQPRG